MRRRDPEQAWLLVQGAASVASTLEARAFDRGRYTAGQRADLQARTQTELANAYRRKRDLAHAEECLGKAAALAGENLCSPRTKGRWMKVSASVLMDLGRVNEAFDLLDQLHRFYHAYGETDLASRVLISQGIALYNGDRHHEAAGALRRGFFALTPG